MSFRGEWNVFLRFWPLSKRIMRSKAEEDRNARDARCWLECRGVDRNGYSPWNGFIVPGFIPAMVVHPVKSTNSWICWGRWINPSIHGRKSTDGRKMRGGHFDRCRKIILPFLFFFSNLRNFWTPFLPPFFSFSSSIKSLKDINKIFPTIQSMQQLRFAAPRVSIEGMELEREEKCVKERGTHPSTDGRGKRFHHREDSRRAGSMNRDVFPMPGSSPVSRD